MDEPFEITVLYKGDELVFEASLVQFGYSHRIEIRVGDQQVLFEPDEERNYRAVIQSVDRFDKLDLGLLKAIAETIESILK